MKPREIKIDLTNMKKIIRNNHVQLYIHKLTNLEEMDNSSKTTSY